MRTFFRAIRALSHLENAFEMGSYTHQATEYAREKADADHHIKRRKEEDVSSKTWPSHIYRHSEACQGRPQQWPGSSDNHCYSTTITLTMIES